MNKAAKVWAADFRPMIIKELVLDCGISQGDIGDALGVSRSLVNAIINRGYQPPTLPDVRGNIGRYLLTAADYAIKVQSWLAERGLVIADIWTPGRELKGKHVANLAQRSAAGMQKPAPVVPGDPDEIIMNWEAEMITQEAMRKYRIFRQPFANDVQRETDIYLSEDHRYIKEAMLEAARNKGLAAIVGEVGSGKSTIRKAVIEQLKRDGNMRVVYPRIINKKQITAATLCDAIIMDISDEKPRVKHEHKARQVIKLLVDRVGIGVDCVLIIEEAHKLTIGALQDLKQFWELEEGFSKLLGIILVGQPELEGLLDESAHPDLRELIRRTQLVKIGGLNGDLRDYLTHKLKRVGADIDKIFAPEAVDALSRRLTFTTRDGKGKISHAYPLLVNNWATRAINLAHEYGEDLVTADVVEAL